MTGESSGVSIGLTPVVSTTAPRSGTDCWNRIGIAGDRSCPELATHIHCRNCPVFAASARAFFDRPAPEGYLAEWTRWLAGRAEGTVGEQANAEGQSEVDRETLSVLTFRLGREWLAFRTATVAEVTLPRPVHHIPHRSGPILTGLVNLRGQLQLCVSLHGLLGIQPLEDSPGQSPPGVTPGPSDERASAAPPLSGTGRNARLVVLRDRDRSESWVFGAEEVLGVQAVSRGELRSVPSTLANPTVSFSQAILSLTGRSVAYLDEQRVFAALRSPGQ